MFSVFNNLEEIFEAKRFHVVNSLNLLLAHLGNLHMKNLLTALRNLVSFSLVSDFVVFFLIKQ